MQPHEYRTIREALGLTRPELAERLGCDASTIKKRETGVCGVTAAAAVDIERLRTGKSPPLHSQAGKPNGAGQAAGIAAHGTPRRAHRRVQPVVELTPVNGRAVAIGLGVAGAAVAGLCWFARRAGTMAGILAALAFSAHAGSAYAQDAEVTCSQEQVGMYGQRCHTIDGWELLARIWCDRAQVARERRDNEQTLGWGTNVMYLSSRGAEFARDLQIEADTGSICSYEQAGLIAAQRAASGNMQK